MMKEATTRTILKDTMLEEKKHGQQKLGEEDHVFFKNLPATAVAPRFFFREKKNKNLDFSPTSATLSPASLAPHHPPTVWGQLSETFGADGDGRQG